MVNVHFYGTRSHSRSLYHHHHHHHGHHHRTHSVIECGDSKLCNGFFIFIFLAIIIGFIVAAVKGSLSVKTNHTDDHKYNNKKW